MYSNKSNKLWGVAVAIIVIVILGLITLFTAMRGVGTGNIGVVTEYGRVTGRELSEGFAWVAPWGIDHVTQYSIKTQKEEQSATAATNDLQDVSGKVVVNYHIERGKVSTIHKTVGVNYMDVLITPAIQEVFKSSTAKFNATELINNREQLKNDVLTGLKSRLTDRGIIVEDVSITNLEFSKEFTKAIEQRQVAQQNAEKAKYNLQQAELDTKAQDVQAKTLTPEYLELQAIQKWDGKLPEYLGGGTVFNLPLK